MIITIIITLTRIGTIAWARNTIIETMSTRVITAIIMAPITFRVTLLGPLGVPNDIISPSMQLLDYFQIKMNHELYCHFYYSSANK